jgi:S-adenosyl-L-methionine hydrolase (adenosine-forming)
MRAPLITLTTDFGTASPYVAAMKGALLAVNPHVQLVELSHSLPPQDLRFCSYFLRASVPYFPEGALHVVVVDPGVGTDRAILFVDLGPQRLLVPDNGCWTELGRTLAVAPAVVNLTNRRYWRTEVSPTFHGRDIFAPVAGHLSLGVLPHQLGPQATSWVDLALPAPRLAPELLAGEVLFVDDFGNLLTNLPGDIYLHARERIHEIQVGDQIVTRQVRTYSEASPGEVVVLVSSAGTVEVAEVKGSAARRLGAHTGTSVNIRLRLSP